MSSNLHQLAHNHTFGFPSIPKPNPSVGRAWLLPETASFTSSNHSIFLCILLPFIFLSSPDRTESVDERRPEPLEGGK